MPIVTHSWRQADRATIAAFHLSSRTLLHIERSAAMPIVNIDLAWLNRLLGKPYRDGDAARIARADRLRRGRRRRDRASAAARSAARSSRHPLGQDEVKACGFCGFESETPFKPAGKQQVMRLDLLADRPDLFDVGGLARALRGTLGIESGLPKYAVKPSGLTVTVDKSVADKSSYRPFIACAVMTLPPVDETSLIAIMKLQENLHWGVGRDRKLASIGVYDMATISGRHHVSHDRSGQGAVRAARHAGQEDDAAGRFSSRIRRAWPTPSCSPTTSAIRCSSMRRAKSSRCRRSSTATKRSSRRARRGCSST